MNSKFSANPLQNGDCYIYTTIHHNNPTQKRTFGFLIFKDPSGYHHSLQFVIVVFKENKVENLEQFKKGIVYISKIGNDVPGSYSLALQGYSFRKKEFAALEDKTFLGNIKL